MPPNFHIARSGPDVARLATAMDLTSTSMILKFPKTPTPSLHAHGFHCVIPSFPVHVSVPIWWNLFTMGEYKSLNWNGLKPASDCPASPSFVSADAQSSNCISATAISPADAAVMLLMPRVLSTSARAQSCKPSGCATSSSSSAICQSVTASASKPVSLQHQSKNSEANALVTTQSRYHKAITALAAQCTGADCCRCRKLRRSSSAVATSGEGHRTPRSGRAVRHRRLGREP